ncbi:ABC transporter permease [Robertmurraya andreesenii]|uniref:ABC-2 type transport system permease protein n=1 Tax=Anoxybacillus andreesenii TaxID=1325932 RepID=A0ABT9V0B6_9BACL|nr:ABC transporter permease subunit [Robertmurraya andreesenii]MDQ0154384.1 ABC-2 type transport system permease protein [Robertmurraya andreesenii]
MHYVWKEWKENLKGKGLWLSFAIIVLVSISLLVRSSSLSIDKGFYVLLINLFDAFVYFIPILCLFLGAFALFQEKEQKTLIMLLTRRDSFRSFLFKKSIAVQSVLLGPMILWFFLYVIPLKFFYQIEWSAYGFYLLSVICLVLVFTQIGIFVGSISRTRMQIVGFTIAIWFYFFFLHDFILLSFLPDVSYENVKLFSSLYFLNPLQAARMFLESSLGVYSFEHMSKLLQSFMWMKPGLFLLGNVILLVLLSFVCGAAFHRKEGSE